MGFDKVNKRVNNERADKMANGRFSIISTWDENAKTFCHFDMRKHWLVEMVKWQDDSQWQISHAFPYEMKRQMYFLMQHEETLIDWDG